MAVMVTPIKSDLTIRVISGLDDDGKDVLQTKSFSKVKVDAADQDVFDVANAIAAVLLSPVFDIKRVNAELLEEGM
ncbi:DUF1659 domain-containing protein [Clostridium grantii]|uniref:DUF1659 domain-containing protein n=1 Tax=Clostridium grantii DSM 8605 TaxID=1121316 RepID=A0A1M5XMI9_9CLOT|nr:DUF1659 domain-containing protein [Clostridium grantii]SHI01040.1 Protein of unknown function [Clostridium grantii DSM 8605]